MNCPKCCVRHTEFQHFCSNCGINLDDNATMFIRHKKNVKKEFLAKCRDVIGGNDGCSKIGQAAWFIATNTKSNFDYLQGEKMGCRKSYELLSYAVDEAGKIARYLSIYSNAYRNGEPIGLITGQFFGVLVHNPIEIQPETAE